jgi:lysophospholipase L1-like esterase
LSRVFNSGIPGDTTRELLARFNRDVASKAPTLVILWVGINDRLYPGHTVELAELKNNYVDLLERIESIGAKVLIGTLPGQYLPYLFEQFPEIAKFPESPAKRIAPVNAFLHDLNLPLADFEATINHRPIDEVPESYLQNLSNSGVRDGIHLTAAGAIAVAQCAADAVAYYKLPTERIVCFGDSLTYGHGLKRIDTYPYRLSELL